MNHVNVVFEHDMETSLALGHLSCGHEESYALDYCLFMWGISY